MMNSLALQDALRQQGVEARVQSALRMDQVVEPYIRPRAIRHMSEGKVVIFAAGTGNPFFTTDTAAALRGAEMGVDIVLKATKVDGIYSSDPNKNPDAVRYESITFDEAIVKNLQVMDATAFALCRDRQLPIKVFSIFKEGSLLRVVNGEKEGTLVIAVVDTNHSPDGVDYIIPGNDDSSKAVALYVRGMTDAILEGKASAMSQLVEAIKDPEEAIHEEGKAE